MQEKRWRWIGSCCAKFHPDRPGQTPTLQEQGEGAGRRGTLIWMPMIEMNMLVAVVTMAF